MKSFVLCVYAYNFLVSLRTSLLRIVEFREEILNLQKSKPGISSGNEYSLLIRHLSKLIGLKFWMDVTSPKCSCPEASSII